jgi:diguanylate cyclase (GGDEF)-like protein
VEIARGRHTPRKLSLVMFDADHFKNVNDTHGHPAGDAVLRRLAALLTTTFREVDVVARVGGEEFAVLLPSTGLSGAAAVAERFRQAVAAQPIVADGVSIACTVSGGVATMETGSTDLDALLERADRALYAAKAAGRNRIACSSVDDPAAPR